MAIGTCVYVLWLLLYVCKKTKENKKNDEEIKQTFSFISRECLKQFSSNLVCGLLVVKDISTSKIVLFRKDSIELQIMFSSSCQYSHGIVCQLELHDILPCVLIGTLT